VSAAGDREQEPAVQEGWRIDAGRVGTGRINLQFVGSAILAAKPAKIWLNTPNLRHRIKR
jgi:hypothetical protein